MSKRSRAIPDPTPTRSAEEQALARARTLLSDQAYALLLAELEKPLRSALRINPLKSGAESIGNWARRYGWEVERVPYCDTGWWLRLNGVAAVFPGKTIEHRLGAYYIQDAASMLPVELFETQPESNAAPLVLDMAASPGGKTTHLISKNADRGLVIANDSSRERITALRFALQNWGATSAAVTQFPGEYFGAWFSETFDRVLLDAPCSMESLRSTDSHPMRPITARERAGLAKRQERLLESALQAVRVGGQVVYATCTLAPEEDEAVLDALLKRHPGAFEVFPAAERLQVNAPGLTGTAETSFHPALKNALRLWPHCCRTAGFFCALLQKCDSLPVKEQAAPQRSLTGSNFAPLTRAELSGLTAEYETLYGFNLAHLLESLQLEAWRRGNELYAFPELYLHRFSFLPVQALGLSLAQQVGEEILPSHEWVARFGAHFINGRVCLSAQQAAAWVRGEDLRGNYSPAPHGGVVVVEDESGRLLGRGKLQTGRIKNLLPRRLVLV